jgi:Domain of unknown function (DUF4129)
MIDDRFRAALDSVFAGPAYRWEERPDPFAVFGRIWQAFIDWLIALWARSPLVFDVVAWTLAALLVVLAVRAVSVLIRQFRAPLEREAPVPAGLVARGPGWFRREAARLREEGRWLDAMGADFHALLLELDARRLVRYHPAKTPQEYVGEAALDEASRARLRDLVWTLYRHEFGRDPVTPAIAEAWRELTGSDRYAPAH